MLISYKKTSSKYMTNVNIEIISRNNKVRNHKHSKVLIQLETNVSSKNTNQINL